MSRLLRSVLYVPGINEKAMRKSATLAVDAVVFDLEDSVLPDHKVEARAKVSNYLKEKRSAYPGKCMVIRINGLDTNWWQKDIEMAIEAAPDAILIPKVTSPEILNEVHAMLSEHPELALELWCMIENPMGILRLREIVEQGMTKRLSCLVLGTNDLVKDSDLIPGDGRRNLMPWFAHVMLVAKAFNMPVIDGVLNDIHDVHALTSESSMARDLGMSGKTIIHPAQLDTVNSIFSPTEAQIAWWRQVVGAFDLPENKDKGVINLGGAMVERLHLDIARRGLEGLCRRTTP